MKLKTSVIKQIKNSVKILRALEDLHDRKSLTIRDWLYKNDYRLCMPDSLRIISAYLKLPVKDLVEPSSDTEKILEQIENF